jgi:hypothetical protein
MGGHGAGVEEGGPEVARRNLILGFLALAATTLPASGDITDWYAADDGDGAIVCTTAWDPMLYELAVDGVQYWHPGHVLGWFTTDTEDDPTIWVRNTVTNEGDVPPLVWTDYHIDITMNKTFDILDAATLVNWDYTYTPTATYDPDLGLWVGTVDYVMGMGGSPVNMGEDGEFDFKISFLGSIEWCEAMTPTPEPATLALLGLGALLIRRRK